MAKFDVEKVIKALEEQAADKDSLNENDDDDIFAQDAEMLREAVKIIKDNADRISNLSAECEIWEQKVNEYIGKAEAYQDVLLSLFSMVLTGGTR